jgi:hypothetical protein
MQYFGEFQSKYEEVFLTSSYMYFNWDDEDTKTVKDIKQMIKTNKDRKKNIAGTIFLYNPVVTPIGFDSKKFLLDQGFDAFDQYVPLKAEGYITVFKQALQEHYKGKLVEIKNLFNLNEPNIGASQLLMKFNDDLEKYNSSQNTEFEREIMYFDAQTFVPAGKFVLFAWGEKISHKEFPYIKEYAKTIFQRCVDMGKKVCFVYKKEKSKEGSIEFLQFSHPTENIKYKNQIANAMKKVFQTTPPESAFYE